MTPSDLTPGGKLLALANAARLPPQAPETLTKVRATEAASKEALRAYCEEHGWRVAFFEGKTGAPRTGIIGAIIFRLRLAER